MKLLSFIIFTAFTLTTGVLHSQESENKGKEEEVIWKIHSKNKSHTYIDHKAKTGSEKDTFNLYTNESFMEGTYKNFSFGGRKTLVVFSDREFDSAVADFDYKYSNELLNHSWEHWLDRLYLKGKWKKIQFTVGDFYESMNRGMAFSMKNDPVYGDNSIRGVNITSSHDGFFFKAFGGRANPQIRDKATFQRMKEPDDWLAGLESGYKWKKVEFSIQYGYGNYGKYSLVTPQEKAKIKESLDASKEFHLTGASIYLKNPFPRFTWYTGAVYVPYGHEKSLSKTVFGEREPLVETEKKRLNNAFSLYSNALYYFDFGKKKSRLTFKLEGKVYNKFFLNYSRMEDPDYQRRYFSPPTLLPKELQIDNEFDTWAVGTRIALNEGRSGAKFHIDFVKGDTFGNKKAFPSSQLSLITEYKEEDFWYVAGGGEKSWNKFALSAGAGYHTAKGENSNKEFKNDRNWIISYLYLSGHISKFSAKFTNDYYIKDLWVHGVREMDYAHELKTVLDISWDKKYFASFKNTFWKNKPEGKAKWYAGGSIGFKKEPFRIYCFGGLEKGGYVCDGGACRYLPDFKGLKLEVDIAL
ncbi:MAG: DUF6029 family protein [bacterium]